VPGGSTTPPGLEDMKLTQELLPLMMPPFGRVKLPRLSADSSGSVPLLGRICAFITTAVPVWNRPIA